MIDNFLLLWGLSHVEEELPTLPEHLTSSLVFSRVRVARSLIFCVMFCRSLFVIFLFSHCIICTLIYGLWLPLWYLQTFLIPFKQNYINGRIITFAVPKSVVRRGTSSTWLSCTSSLNPIKIIQLLNISPCT